MRAGGKVSALCGAGAQDKLRVLLTWAEIIRSIEVSVGKVTDSRDGRVTARFKGGVQMAETSAQAVLVRTASGQDLAYPGATSLHMDRRGDLRVMQGLRRRAFHPRA